MTRRQRIIKDVVFIKKNNVLGAGRTAALTALMNKYDITIGRLRALCLHTSGADYWN